MIDDTEMLNTITSTADMGRDSLNHVIEKATDPQLKSALQKQYNQYDNTYKDAEEMLRIRNENPQKSGAVVKSYSHLMSDMKILTSKDSNSKIAEMVIQGNTMGITEITKQLNNYNGGNTELINLSQNCVQAQQDNIEEMKMFL